MTGVVELVKNIVGVCAREIPGAEVIAPLPVWDGQHGSMGVQIKAPQNRGAQKCEIIAGFVLSPEVLADPRLIRAVAVTAVTAMIADVQIQVRPIREQKKVG